MKSNRVGLSEYTARRLAELRARRAEADDTGGISIGASSSAVASDNEAIANDCDVSAPSSNVTSQQPAVAPLSCSSTQDSNAVSPVSAAAQLPSSPTLPPLSKTESTSVSAPAVAVANGLSEKSPEAVGTSVDQKQSGSIKPESIPSSELRKIDRPDFGSPRVAAEIIKPAAQHREMPQPSPFVKTNPRSNDPTTFSGSAVEVGTLSKMASFLVVVCNHVMYKILILL